MSARVVRISIAPVKALGLVHPDSVELGRTGVAGDRRFWLVTADGRLVNGKTHPELMRIRPRWDERSRLLELNFPGGEVVAGTVEPGEPVEAALYRVPHPSRRIAGPWQEAISEFAGAPLTLLWSDGGAVDRGADGGWVSLVSRASLRRLGDEAGVDGSLDGRRFRMLFEIDGVSAHEEDRWIGTRVRIGEAVVAPGGDVGRCLVTTCDPDSGVSDVDTLKALARYRREGVTEPLPFGVHGDVVAPGRVAVGGAVEPLASTAA